MREKWWVSFPSRYGWMTTGWDVVDGIVRETYTAAPELRGMTISRALAVLRRCCGDALLAEKLP